MAKLTVGDYINLGTKDPHTATDWQVAMDENFELLIDESLEDAVNVKEWHTPLPRLDGTGFYSDEDIIYARIRIRFGDIVSPWLVLSDNQNYQEVTITKDGVVILETNSDVINLQ